MVSFEKLQFLQKAHIQRLVKSGGPEFDEMVKKVSLVVEESHSLDKL